MKFPTDREAMDMIIKVGRALYEEGLNVGTDGNISCKVSANELWTTCSGSAKGWLTDDDIVMCDMDGNKIRGDKKPSSELKVHLCVYRENVLANACVHAHPVAATAMASMGMDMAEAMLPPVLLQLGKVYTAPYALTGTQAVADSIAPFAADNNAVLLANHGAVTWGADLWQAYTRMETLERCAEITLETERLGRKSLLTEAQAEELHALGVKMGNFVK